MSRTKKLSENIKNILTNINFRVIIFIVKPKHYFYLEVITMKKLNTLGKVITKILEVFHWVGVALMIAAIICSVAAPNLVGYFVGFDAKECCGANP